MVNKFPFKLAVNAMLIILSVIIVFHVLVLIQVIPYTIVWAGKIKSIDEMKKFEFMSIIINVLIILVVSLSGNYLKWNISVKLIKVFLWFFVVLFSLNTVGNFLAKSSFEILVFTPLTFIMAFLCLRIALGDNRKKE